MLKFLFQNNSIADTIIAIGLGIGTASILVFILGLGAGFVDIGIEATTLNLVGGGMVVLGFLLVLSGTSLG